MKIIIVLILLATPMFSICQNVGIGTVPDNSAALDVSSSNKGLLIPRMSTAQRSAIPSPAVGLLVYDTGTKSFWYYTGTGWTSLANNESKQRSIYIAGNGLGYAPSANIAITQYGLNLSNTAGQVSFIIPKPVDWDSTQTFTITLHFSLPTNTANTFINWRLTAGGMIKNASQPEANTGWDSYNYYTTEDAPLLVSYASASYSNLSKSQSWTAKWSTTYNTWYFGTSVTVANSFLTNPVWRIGFIRGSSVNNGETYSGNITVNAATITYIAK